MRLAHPLWAALALVQPLTAGLPLAFEPNRGQAAAPTRYLARGHGYTILLDGGGATLGLRGQPLSLRFAGAGGPARIVPAGPLPSRSHYLRGPDAAEWITAVPHYGRVRYEAVYPGVDALFYGSEGRLEYDFVLAPGSDPARLRVAFTGQRSLSLSPEGDLVVATAGGTLVQRRPVAFQETPGGRRMVRAGYRIQRNHEVSFVLGPYDRRLPLIIDPVLVYGTYFGGTGFQSAAAVAVDAAGNAYIAGNTASVDMPAPGGLQPSRRAATDAFLAKVAPDGSSLLYATYLGGFGGASSSFAVAVDVGGAMYLAGSTNAADFPTTAGAYKRALTAPTCGFVAKLNAGGASLSYSTLLCGNANSTVIRGMAVDAAGAATLAGETSDPAFPTTAGAYQRALKGTEDAFVTRLNPAGSGLAFSTLLGGAGADRAAAVAVDAGGNAYLTGNTQSTDFPTLAPIQSANRANPRATAFVTKLNAAGTALVYSTYLGGTYSSAGNAIAVDAAGAAYVAGSDQSLSGAGDFPLVTPAQSTHGGFLDAFLAKLAPAGNALAYSTYFGGLGSDVAVALGVDAGGNAVIAGTTTSANLPTMSALQTALAAGAPNDGFLARYSPAGALQFATFLGGSQSDIPQALAVDAAGAAFVAGNTTSTDMAVTPGVFAPFPPGQTNAFLVKVDMQAPNCGYALGGGTVALPAAGGAGSALVNTETGCAWRAFSASSWLSLSSTPFGQGPGPVAFTAQANLESRPRFGSIQLRGGQTQLVLQDGTAGSCPAAPIGLDQIVNGSLSASDCRSPYRNGRIAQPAPQPPLVGAPAPSDLYTFTALAGQQVAIELSSAQFDAFLVLVGPDGQVLAQQDDVSRSNCTLSTPDAKVCVSFNPNARVPLSGFLTLPATGTYHIDVTSYGPNEAGAYTLRVSGGVTPPQPPQLLAVSPAAGAGAEQVFRFELTDANGFTDITRVQAFWSANGGGAASCLVYFDRASNTLALLNDAGTAFSAPAAIGSAGVLENSQCVVMPGSSSAAGNSTALTLQIALRFKGAFAGPKTILAEVLDSSGASTGYRALGEYTVSPPANQPPSVLSVSPQNASGARQVFTLQVSDPNGASDIQRVQALFATSIATANACLIYYDRPTGQLRLMNDAGTAFLAPAALGSGVSLENAQCAVNAANSTATVAGSAIVLALDVSFRPVYGGPKSLFVEALDAAGAGTGYVLAGSYTVLTGGNVAPQVGPMTPALGGGTGQTFTFTFSDGNGFADIQRAQILFNASLGAAGGCLVYFNRAANTLLLLDDAGFAFLGPVAIGGGAIQNAQCMVNAGAAAVSGAGNTLTLALPVQFAPSFAGAKGVFAETLDAAGVSSGYVSVGSYNVLATANRPPAPLSVTPNAGFGAAQTFNFQFGDADGAGDIHRAQVLVNGALNAAAGCLVYYNRAANTLLLLDDAASAWLGPVALGAAGTLQNSQCAVNAAGSTAAASGTTLTLSLALAFQQAFSGARTLFAETLDNSGVSSGYLQLGSWNVTTGVNRAPALGTAAPSAGAGAAQTFSFKVSDPDGGADIARMQVLLNASLNAAGGCLVYYARSSNTILLMNDAGTAFLGPVPAGSAAAVENSQCSVNAAGAGAVVSGNDLIVTLPVAFKAAFAGSRVMFAEALDNANVSTGYQIVGNWTVTAP